MLMKKRWSGGKERVAWWFEKFSIQGKSTPVQTVKRSRSQSVSARRVKKRAKRKWATMNGCSRPWRRKGPRAPSNRATTLAAHGALGQQEPLPLLLLGPLRLEHAYRYGHDGTRLRIWTSTSKIYPYSP